MAMARPSLFLKPQFLRPPFLKRRLTFLRLPDFTARQYSFAVLFALAACATASSLSGPGVRLSPAAPELSISERAASFQLKPPAPDQLGPELKFWATRYQTPIVSAAAKTATD